MNRSKHTNLPEPHGLSEAYKKMLKKEGLAKPASVTNRNEILKHMQRQNYKLEYERILGLLEGHAQMFNTPGGHFQKDKLINRLQTLKKMFREVHNPEKHPIEQK